MTKTFTAGAVVPYRCTNLCSSVIMPFGTNVGGHLFVILNFRHWDLFEIWFLVLVIFMFALNN
jgi:hypothetical protein